MNNTITPAEDMTGKELKAEIALYAQAGIEDFVAPDAAAKVAELAAFVTEMRSKHGIPHEVTEEDLKANEGIEDAKKLIGEVGEVILLPVPEAAPVSSTAAPEAPVEAPAAANLSGQTPKKPVAAPEAHTAQLYHSRRPVLSVVNKLVNGRVYKQITLPDSTMLLTQEEYDKTVGPNFN